MISSAANPRLKAVRALQRRRERERAGVFVVEGEDLVAAARAAGAEPDDLLVGAGSGLEGEEVEPELLDAASGLGSGTRVIGVFPLRPTPPAGELGLGTVAAPLVVHLHGLRDPGNVGTAIRSAHALGAAAVSLGPGTADPHGPKAVRASMGALFAVPLVRASGPWDLPGTTVGLDAAAPEPLRGPAAGPTTLLVGAEREGLPADVLAACAQRRRLPMRAFDSLNAAMAATVACYELLREVDPAATHADGGGADRPAAGDGSTIGAA